MSWPTKKLLIAGIPGMGKTKIGDHLQERYGFTHVDMENSDNISAIIKDHKTFIDNLLSHGRDIVLTWGFVPTDQQIGMVNYLGNKGFKKIWFDGDRGAARREFIKRDSQFGEMYLNAKLEALGFQMKRIEESKVIDRIEPKIINTFDSAHNFKKSDEIITEILNE